jgi:predicted RNA-binding Zn-ribbon protein involved in translation (DUF1610 family)
VLAVSAESSAEDDTVAIKFRCPNTGKTLKARESIAGKTAKCPACGETHTIPRQALVPVGRGSADRPANNAPRGVSDVLVAEWMNSSERSSASCTSPLSNGEPENTNPTDGLDRSTEFGVSDSDYSPTPTPSTSDEHTRSREFEVFLPRLRNMAGHFRTPAAGFAELVVDDSPEEADSQLGDFGLSLYPHCGKIVIGSDGDLTISALDESNPGSQRYRTICVTRIGNVATINCPTPTFGQLFSDRFARRIKSWLISGAGFALFSGYPFKSPMQCVLGVPLAAALLCSVVSAIGSFFQVNSPQPTQVDLRDATQHAARFTCATFENARELRRTIQEAMAKGSQ